MSRKRFAGEARSSSTAARGSKMRFWTASSATLAARSKASRLQSARPPCASTTRSTTVTNALANLKDVQDRRSRAMQDVHNGGLRQEISDSFSGELKSAQDA